jgi:2-methylisocitrate lyase-like PEP mutase family enzyme
MTNETETGQSKGEALRELHAGEPFVIPNPWDAGSAKMLASLGFKALATTSSGFAFTLGRHDGGVTLDEVCAHVTAIDQATPLPVSTDLENGYGPRPEDAAEAIRRVAHAGAVGASIEDFDPDDGLYEAGFATERVAAAVEAARALDVPFTLTARAENFLRDNPDLDDTIARLQAFEAAGADVLYAPRLKTIEQIEAVCSAVSKPVNVLGQFGGPSISAIFAAGAQRISVGGWLGWVAYGAAYDAAKGVAQGDIDALRSAFPVGEALGD